MDEDADDPRDDTPFLPGMSDFEVAIPWFRRAECPECGLFSFHKTVCSRNWSNWSADDVRWFNFD